MNHLLYHANCADGFAAACIARFALCSSQSEEWAAANINIAAVNYGESNQLPVGDHHLQTGDHVTYLDYTPPQHVIDTILNCAKGVTLTIIDHHSTAAERHGRDKDTGLPRADLPLPRFNSWFNLTHSGASLAWTVFQSSPIPRAVELIEYRDLGHAFDPANAADPRTADALNLHAYLFRCLPRTFEAWTPLLLSETTVNNGQPGQPPSTSLSAALQTGSRLREIDRWLIKTAADFPHWLNFHGEEIPAVNGLDAGLVSDACTELLRAYPTAPFAASWFINPNTGHATYSLRSRRDSTVNVADIAKSFHPNGGGHPNAAGFSTPIPIPFV